MATGAENPTIPEGSVTDRISCVVPFCRRTTKRLWETQEWVCGIHWRLVPREMRQRLFKYRRLVNRMFTRGVPNQRAKARESDQWEKCKSAAIERAAGITA